VENPSDIRRYRANLQGEVDSAAVYGAPATLAFLAIPLLIIELPVVIIFVVLTLARQRNDRSRASRGARPAPGAA